MITEHDDFPHPVPIQAFMTWKENWVFPGVDLDAGVAVLFHFSLRPALGEGIFTAKANGPGVKIRYVGRSPVPRDLRQLVPVRDRHVTFTVVEPLQHFHLHYAGPDGEIDAHFRARFPAWDFADGPKPEGESPLGPVGLSVFPFHHYEQGLTVEGFVRQEGGPAVPFSGYGNRDHSWGWRDDFCFRKHHWVCASFADRYVQGSTMLETTFPTQKHGGFVSTALGNVATTFVDTSGTYWEEPANEPLPAFDRPARYVIRTADGEEHHLVAHIDEAIAKLYLNARSEDRSQVYQDCQIFCRYTDEHTGEVGAGILELGKFIEGPGIADRLRRE
jgi:hypothetical protein